MISFLALPRKLGSSPSTVPPLSSRPRKLGQSRCARYRRPRAASSPWRRRKAPCLEEPSTWRGGRSSSVPASLDCPMPAEAPSTSAPSMHSSLGDLECPPPTSTRRGRCTPTPPAPGDGDFLSSFLLDGTTVVAILIPCVHLLDI
jgi:hypothetical protein